jgi:hypothetical protein
MEILEVVPIFPEAVIEVKYSLKQGCGRVNVGGNNVLHGDCAKAKFALKVRHKIATIRANRPK